MNKRYFLVTFNPNSLLAFGSICIESEGFFSYNYLLEKIQEQNDGIDNIVIINIFEFKCEYDYKIFTNQIKIK